MNTRIEMLAEQADLLGNFTPTKIPGHYAGIIKITDIKKFAELIVLECIRLAMDELVLNEDIDTITDIEDRCYLQGNNTGVVDTVVSIKQYFGVEE